MLISLKKKTAPVTDKDHISLLLPTRGRPQMLREVFDSLEQTTAQKNKIAAWIYVDHDDQTTLDAIAAGQFKNFSFEINWVVGERTASLGEIHNILWRECTSGSGIFMLHADDTLFVTPGWDEVVRQGFNTFPDRILTAYPHDPALHEPTFQMMLSAEWMAVTGYFSTAHFPFWFDDIWLDQIGQIIGRRLKLPIRLQPIGGKGKTMRMRNMAFWTSFFNHTLDERVHAAEILRKIIFPQPSAERDQNEREGRAVIEQLRAEGENFSDIYALFREERHSSLSAEQRRDFDENYFGLEAKAVGKLLAKAKALVRAKRFRDADAVLDAILYSDIRASQLNHLKAECLEAAGKSAEAEQLRRERAQVWPENPLLRRILRFIAMIFVEAKRMIYSKW